MRRNVRKPANLCCQILHGSYEIHVDICYRTKRHLGVVRVIRRLNQSDSASLTRPPSCRAVDEKRGSIL
jgi:hypothetical protein